MAPTAGRCFSAIVGGGRGHPQSRVEREAGSQQAEEVREVGAARAQLSWEADPSQGIGLCAEEAEVLFPAASLLQVPPQAPGHDS